MMRVIAYSASETSALAGASPMRRLTVRMLSVPLIAKLIGANIIIVIVAAAIHVSAFSERGNAELVAVFLALAVASFVNFFLVRLALQPIADLEKLAGRVSAGEYDARGTKSPFADPSLAHLGATVNTLLDSLAAERARIQQLGAEVIYAQDAERSRVSRELHDSIAQTLAAVRFQLAAAGANLDFDTRNRIAAANGMIGTALEEVKNMSYSLHTRVAEDLGLESALDALASQVRTRSGVEVSVVVSISGPPLPRNVKSTLFRVAQEALRNIEMHSRARKATVDIVGRDGLIRIEVADDGCGFDMSEIKPQHSKSALASIHNRVALAGGTMSVESVPNGGTRVTAEMQTIRAAS